MSSASKMEKPLWPWCSIFETQRKASISGHVRLERLNLRCHPLSDRRMIAMSPSLWFFASLLASISTISASVHMGLRDRRNQQ